MRRSSAMRAAATGAVAVLATISLTFVPALTASAARPGLPDGFHAQSQSWISPKDGWLLGSATCGQTTCTSVIGTTDGGKTWNSLGQIDAPLTFEDKSGVTEIRFADAMHGWAFQPSLWATNDGGATWKKKSLPGNGHLEEGLSANASAAYAIVSPCTLNQGDCTDPSALWKTKPGSGTWKKVSGVSLPSFTAFGEAGLSQFGSVAYVSVPAFLDAAPGSPAAMDYLYATTDGKTWSTRPDPCDPSNDETLTAVAAFSDTKVAFLCQANIGFGKAAKRAVRSSDTGLTTKGAGKLPLLGIMTQMAAAPNGTLAVASYSIGSWIYLNQGGKTWTTQEDLGDGGQGWNDIMFVSNSTGFVIHSPVFCCGDHGVGELWETQDGGLTWSAI